jgi:SAM-dependent methyltransferase
MKANATDWSKHQLVIVFDGSSEEAKEFGEAFRTQKQVWGGLAIWTREQLGVGGAKNAGVRALAQEYHFHEDDILMFSDNDMYYLPGWDKRLEYCLDSFDVTQLGGWKHPYHTQGEYLAIPCEFDDGWGKSITSVDAVTGNCFVIRWADWLKYGPFDANAIGPGQSEDYALSQKIKAGGGIVATLDPPVAIHVGLSNCLGEPATGYKEMSQMAEAQMKEYGIDKIWLATPDEGTILLEHKTEQSNLLYNNSIVCGPRRSAFSGINCGSGQRRFDATQGWINVDCVARPPDQVPDVICDANKLVERFGVATQDMVVLHHVLEHFGCGEADDVIRQCYEVLKPGGSLLVFVPDMSKLAGRWLSGEISDYIFFVNAYGAYQGEDGDRHKWGFSSGSLVNYLHDTLQVGYPFIKFFDWREIPGADIARDWWVSGIEVCK